MRPVPAGRPRPRRELHQAWRYRAHGRARVHRFIRRGSCSMPCSVGPTTSYASSAGAAGGASCDAAVARTGDIVQDGARGRRTAPGGLHRRVALADSVENASGGRSNSHRRSGPYDYVAQADGAGRRRAHDMASTAARRFQARARSDGVRLLGRRTCRRRAFYLMSYVPGSVFHRPSDVSALTGAGPRSPSHRRRARPAPPSRPRRGRAR
jgi:hypothetical protein